MNRLDRIISYFSPQRGAERLKHRATMSAVQHYDAAGRSNRTRGYKGPQGDANASVRGGRRLRLVARDMVRNNAIARRAVASLVDNIVGDGIIPSIETGSDANDRWMNDVLRQHLDTPQIDSSGRMDLYGLQRLAVESMIIGGETLIRHRPRRFPDAAGLTLPFQIELLEAEYFDETQLGLNSVGNRVMDGIEFDNMRRRVAYHLYTEHPEDSLAGYPTSVWIPARNVIHMFRVERPGQRRGASWLAPVIPLMNDAYDYADAQLVRQKIAAMWVAFTRDLSPDAVADDDPADVTLRPGMFEHLPAGREVTFSTPPKVDGYSEHMKSVQRMIAAALSMTYEELSGDLEGVNFSSARIGRIAMQRAVSASQWTVVMPTLCLGMEPWLRTAFSNYPDRRPPAEYKFKWTPPKFPMTDPAREIPAVVAQIEAGLTSRQRSIREMGYDPDVIYREIAEDRLALPQPESPSTQANPPEPDGDGDEQIGEDNG